MRRLLLVGLAVGVLTALALSQPSRTFTSAEAVRVEVGKRNPWTHVRLNNDPRHFQFAIVTDRTGGQRADIFARAVEQLNLMQPQFVLSVGDLIGGGDEITAAQWKQFQGLVAQLQMPFFYVPGNHDVGSRLRRQRWEEQFGRRYYHFVYQEVLFLILDCNRLKPIPRPVFAAAGFRNCRQSGNSLDAGVPPPGALGRIVAARL